LKLGPSIILLIKFRFQLQAQKPIQFHKADFESSNRANANLRKNNLSPPRSGKMIIFKLVPPYFLSDYHTQATKKRKGKEGKKKHDAQEVGVPPGN